MQLADEMVVKIHFRRRYTMEGRGFWTMKVVTTPNRVRLWRSIRVLWQNIVGNIGLVVRDGRRITFWDINWIRNAPFKDVLSDILRPTVLPDATLAIMRGHNKDEISTSGDIENWAERLISGKYSNLSKV